MKVFPQGVEQVVPSEGFGPDMLVERGFQHGEKRGFLGIDLWALSVSPCPPRRRGRLRSTSMLYTMCGWWPLSTEA